ncbi:hypothetical protein F5B22DRAFT_421224 [Xylaria bambusicola]|uniref:uncharacterized protein n=1 Tax=Xylaria bambusicola TaxID=326684 RepID=UPI002008BE5A|nr:uncharacterized protein F5B22DRAFT_421224 [Xylaria bambusicola]KAI0523865.1 hypothetical protein F5B22DRAFT_421224 [Xylaria bambusicola]
MAIDIEAPESDDWFNLYERLETAEINPQLSSPFYNGRIPAEIRTLIFEFAVTEFPSPCARTVKPITWVQHSHEPAPIPATPNPSAVGNVIERVRSRISGVIRPPGVMRPRRGMLPLAVSHTPQPKDGFDWLRFDNTEPMEVATALLLTCRRVYLETHNLPLLQTQQRFYCRRGPPCRSDGSEGPRSNIEGFITNLLSDPSPVPGIKQKDLVRSVRLFIQQYWLEDRLLHLVLSDNWFANLEHLRITLRRGDWWDWESNATLRINPFKGNCCHAHTIRLMHQDMATENGNVEFSVGAWGRAFSHMSKLKTLTIDFETSEDKREEMETLVTWALKWRFPLSSSRYLSTGGQPADKISWRGLPHHFSHQCVSGCRRTQYRTPEEECPKCSETRQLISQGYGPQLLVWTCVWKPVQGD